MLRSFSTFALALAVSTIALNAAGNSTGWQDIVRDRIPLFGHRNWIVIADSAYPAQSSDGIETIVSHTDQITVLKFVLAALSTAKHVRPIIHTDQELSYLTEQAAPGVSAYRARLAALLPKTNVQSLPHEQLIRQLDSTSKTFHVLIIKTTLTVPYTTVFLQLDCAYWSPGSETALRSRIAAHKAQ